MQLVVISIMSLAVLLLTLVIGGLINSKRPYACPNCGHIFTRKWYNLVFKFGPIVKEGNGELRLKCPKCAKTDFCIHSNRVDKL